MQFNSDKEMSSPIVIFLHIPKAAGTTLRDILYRRYEKGHIYELDGQNFVQSIEDFKQLPAKEKDEIRLLMGHMYFGLHEYLSSPSTYITMLRNPVKKVISYYHFISRKSNHPDYELIKSQDISLKSYCAMNRANMTNAQTRFLAGEDFSNVNNESKMLEQAKKNLQEHFSVVGITERFDETLILMKQKLGWDSYPYYYRRNTNRNIGYAQLQISEDTLATIREYNQLDIELYEYANELFERDLSVNNNSKLKREASRFSFLNGIYGKYSTFTQKLIFKQGKIKSK
ncbi:MAG: sulfotransferase family 2 domain-containing protein [Cyanobacteria bacterium P01_G01_bin.39]